MKIVQAVNAMISNPGLITNVTQGGSEYFFLYNGTYVWSMQEREDGIHLWFYPNKPSIEELVELEATGDWGTVTLVHYADTEIGSKEAKASFAELFRIVKERLYGIDAVLDDIISSAQ